MTAPTDVPLYAHQQAALDLVRKREGRAGLFMDLGTGKTRTALVAVWEQACERVLIVCPISAIGVWRREAIRIGYRAEFVDLTRADSARAKAAQVATYRRVPPSTGPVVILINYDSYWREPLRSALLKWAPDAVILDEAHRIKHRATRQARFAHILGDRPGVRVKLALTGTPITNGIEDAWSVYRFVEPALFGTWPQFSRAYIRYGGYMARQIVGYNDLGLARNLIAKTSYQCSREDALDLPPRSDIILPVTLAPRTRALYDELRKQGIVELQNHGQEGGVVLARIVLTLLLRLQQVTGGFTVDNETGAVVDIGDEKARACADIVEDAIASGQRVVVFARFLHDVDRIEAAINAAVRCRVARLTGDTSAAQRTDIQDRLHAHQLDVIIAQIRTGSVALDFTPASTGIFYSTGFSLDDFQQASGRIYRGGQTRPVVYYHLLAQDTVDDRTIFPALIRKTNLAREVTSLRYAMTLLNQDEAV